MTREEQYQKVASKEEMDKFKNSDFNYATDSDYFILGAEWADSHPNWHKYPEEKPKPEKPVLCYTAKGTYIVAWQKEKLIGGKPSGQYQWSRWNVPIIAWMDLPQPPKFD